MPLRKKTVVSGAGYTGTPHEESAEETEARVREETERKTPQGQEKANQYYRDVARQGIEEAAVPEQIFLGKSVDPEDFVDGGQRQFIGRAGMRERFGTDMAIGKVSEQMRKKYRIGPDEYLSWTWQDNYANNGRNFEEEWLQNNPDGRIPTDGKGNKCLMQGLVLTALPKPVADEIQAELDKEVAEKNYALAHGNPDLPSNEDELRSMRNQTSDAINRMLQGSPTMGKSLDDALRMYTPEDTAAAIDKYRYLNAPRPETPTAQASEAENVRQRANAIDKAVETAKSQSTGRTSFAVNGFRDKK